MEIQTVLDTVYLNYLFVSKEKKSFGGNVFTAEPTRSILTFPHSI